MPVNLKLNLTPEQKAKKDKDIVSLSLMEDMMPIENANKMSFHITEPKFVDGSGFVVFYSPNCSHCKDFASTYSELSRQLKGQCPLGAVNCLDTIGGNDILSDYLHITGYPTLKFYDKGVFKDYTGGRSLKELLSYVCHVNGICDPYTSISKKQGEKW
jgi:thiol-disulfide isomerase/thioredoxin